jgi:hypothetical protein
MTEAHLLELLQRVTFAVERIANVVAPDAEVPTPAPLPEFPIIEADSGITSRDVAGPHIQSSHGRYFYAVCTYCPARPGRPADPNDPRTWLEYEESSADLDTQRTALHRHVEHHRQQPDPRLALPVWTWADKPCPRCSAPAGRRCHTGSDRPSTAIHSGRWHGQPDAFW